MPREGSDGRLRGEVMHRLAFASLKKGSCTVTDSSKVSDLCKPEETASLSIKVSSRLDCGVRLVVIALSSRSSKACTASRLHGISLLYLND